VPVIAHLEQVVKRYDGRDVLRVSALDVQYGETLAVVGPSGAGKSTLLRLLCLLEAPDAGTLTIDGLLVSAAAPLALRRRITLCFQRPQLLDRSVRDNVVLGLTLRGERDARLVDALLAQLGLSKLACVNVRRISSGEAQRVALARALVLKPALLLLDEPTANLDPVNIALIEAAVADLRRQHGTAVVWVTHNLAQARRVAERVAFVLDGTLVDTTTVTAFFDSPADQRTTAFVNGDMVW
jgi:tungstate transport system ATP-binding protein